MPEQEKSSYSWQRNGKSESKDNFYEGYRMKVRVNKNTHRISIPKSEENETHATIYIEPIDWPKEK